MSKPTGKNDGGEDRDQGTDTLNEILASLEDIKGRISKLEDQEPRASRSIGGGLGGSGSDQAQGASGGSHTNFETVFTAFVSPSPASSGVSDRGADKDLQDRYQSVKEVTKDVEIPGELLLSENWHAKQPDSRRMLALLRKSYSYLLTQLKLLRKLTEERDISSGATKLLLTTMVAHARALQTESSTVFLEGASSHKDPMSLYKALNSNNNLTKHETDTFKLSSKLFVAAKMCEVPTATGNSNSGGQQSKKSKKDKGRTWWNKSSDGGKGRGRDKHDSDQFEQAVSSASSSKP